MANAQRGVIIVLVFYCFYFSLFVCFRFSFLKTRCLQNDRYNVWRVRNVVFIPRIRPFKNSIGVLRQVIIFIFLSLGDGGGGGVGGGRRRERERERERETLFFFALFLCLSKSLVVIHS